jgi:putative FmdB family regulatory protein
MPTYQYRCTECGTDLEAVQKFTDPALTECPTCHGSLRKVFNAVGVVFKGSGFYRTDSRPKEGSSADSSSAGESKGKESKGKESGGKDVTAGGASEKKSSDAGSGSGNGSKSGDGAKAPAKASSGSSTGSSSSS